VEEDGQAPRRNSMVCKLKRNNVCLPAI